MSEAITTYVTAEHGGARLKIISVPFANESSNVKMWHYEVYDVSDMPVDFSPKEIELGDCVSIIDDPTKELLVVTKIWDDTLQGGMFVELVGKRGRVLTKIDQLILRYSKEQ